MKMLVCTIGSSQLDTTVGFAAEVAKALSAEVTLVGVAETKDRIGDLGQALDQIAGCLAERLPVQVRVEAGHMEDVIMKELQQTAYDMVAIGSLSSRRSFRTLGDSVSVRIVKRTQSSVLLIRGARPRLSRVLICASAAEMGHIVVWAGAGLACGAGAQATVLHVADPLPVMFAGLEQMKQTLATLLQSDTEEARELKWAALVVRAECEISELKLRRGIVADEILRESEEGDYDVIVLGSSRAAGGFVRALMGDVTREVVYRAQRPVLVVRPTD
jgi:nucleotide-binding universal stress UspA family protein